jgi:hypothetical protein
MNKSLIVDKRKTFLLLIQLFEKEIIYMSFYLIGYTHIDLLIFYLNVIDIHIYDIFAVISL